MGYGLGEQVLLEGETLLYHQRDLTKFKATAPKYTCTSQRVHMVAGQNVFFERCTRVGNNSWGPLHNFSLCVMYLATDFDQTPHVVVRGKGSPCFAGCKLKEI